MYDREIGEPATKKRESTRPAPVREEQPSREECVLPGFVRAQRQDSDVFRCWFPPPVVPPDYVPVHRFLKPVIACLLFSAPVLALPVLPFTSCDQCLRKSATT